MNPTILHKKKGGRLWKEVRQSKNPNTLFDAFMYPPAPDIYTDKSMDVLPTGVFGRLHPLNMEMSAGLRYPSRPRPALTSAGLAKSAEIGTFPKFSRLPIEIRLMIWKAALPGPRVLDMRLLSLKKTRSEWDHENEKGGGNSFLWEKYSSGVGSPGEICSISNDHKPDGNPPLFGIRSQCKNPAILFVNKEAHSVAAKRYEKVFSNDESLPETYFDFENDTLYIRYPVFHSKVSIHRGYLPNTRQVEEKVIKYLRKLNAVDLARVQKLAIHFRRASQTHRLVEDECAELLQTIFPGVKHLTLVSDHHDSHYTDMSPITFVEPLDIYDAFNSYYSLSIPDGTLDIPRPKPAQSLQQIIFSTAQFHAAMQRKDAAIRRAVTSVEDKKQLPVLIKIPRIIVMIAVSETVKRSPELFLMVSPNLNPNNSQDFQIRREIRDVQREQGQNRFSGKIVQPGIYLKNFKEVVGSSSTASYVEMNWEKYLDLAATKFVKYAEKARKQGLAWWN